MRREKHLLWGPKIIAKRQISEKCATSSFCKTQNEADAVRNLSSVFDVIAVTGEKLEMVMWHLLSR
jgi:hypothetical protein